MATMKENIQYIARHYGYDAQARQLTEEMAELIVALNKEWRARIGDPTIDKGEVRKRIIEELADVEIMIEQIKYLYDCDYEVFTEKIRKTDRQVERMKASGDTV